MSAQNVEYDRPEGACSAAAYDDKGLVMFECDRLDTQPFWCVEDEVWLCPEHAHWAALGPQQFDGSSCAPTDGIDK